jgi:hypothetical protein
MDIVEFIYKLLYAHLPIDKNKIIGLEQDATKFFNSPEVDKNAIGKFIKEYGGTWWAKTLLAVLFIFATRWMSDFMNPVLDGDDDEDDD